MGFYRDTIRKARKEHKCNVCHGIIRVGEKYHDKAGKHDDLWYSQECDACQPVITEFMASNYGDEGYCDEYIQEWWRYVACYGCKHYWPICKPDSHCHPLSCGNLTNGRCLGGDTCDEMTHYCRCEKYESREPVK